LHALTKYWQFVKPTHLEVEKEFEEINISEIKKMTPNQWYNFLLNKYFFWKFTAPNRYKTTTNHLSKYLSQDDGLDNLFKIKEKLFSFDKENIAKGLKIAQEIRGLGPAGASGLLAILFPSHFATVDQFAVKALSEISNLPEKSQIDLMVPEQLKIKEGVILIQLMKSKATALNSLFKTNRWSPRRVDMVLWVSAR
jgi:hypothetical protein